MSLLAELFSIVASGQGAPASLEAFIRRTGVDVSAADDNGVTALHIAALSDWKERSLGIMALLLKLGADASRVADTIHWPHWTPLHVACAEGDVEKVQVLVNAGVDVEAQSRGGLTPLMVAADSTRQPLAKIEALLAGGACRAARDHSGRGAVDHVSAALEADTARLRDVKSIAGSGDSAMVSARTERVRLLARTRDLTRAVRLLATPW
jgi:ankyrin repeat protein